MRPSGILAIVLLALLAISTGFHGAGQRLRLRQEASLPQLRVVTGALGLTDLAVATEARYTRHPAVSDPMVPFMDHPGAIEHFPSGSFWAPPRRSR
ncbi:hypothetical protein ACUUL3_05740 [Thiovibrio sp. JS02]